jgi:hypothetical protein
MDLSSISDQSPHSYQHQSEVTPQSQLQDDHPFRRPKLHLFKKDASRRIKTSSATRNLQPIFPFMEGVSAGNLISGSPFMSSKMVNFNSIHNGEYYQSN